MSIFPSMCEIIPEGVKGVARVEHFEVSKKESVLTAIRNEYVKEGRYCRLIVNNELVMSDTAFERGSNYDVVRAAKGDVLIAGLGIGLILVPILAKPEVRHVLVVEKYRDVIDLVEPSIQKMHGGEKLESVEADIFKWSPWRVKWDCIYFDIWPNVCTDNLEQITALHRKFARRKTSDGWMNSWQAALLRYKRRRGGW